MCCRAIIIALITAGLAAVYAPGTALAQEDALSLDQVVSLLTGGQPRPLVRNLVQRRCRAFEVDAEAESRLTAAGADAETLAAIRAACYDPPAPAPAEPVKAAAPAPRYDPGQALLRGLLVPGLGQFYTGRAPLGIAFLGGAAGAVAFGVLSTAVTVECLARPADGVCPHGQIRDELTERKYLLPGIGAAVALAVIGAFEARSAAARANARAAAESTPAPGAGARLRLEWPVLGMGPGASVQLSIVRLRF